MREILFRGKRIDNGKWFYGSYLFLNVPSHDWTGKEHSKPSEVYFIVDEHDVNYAVYPATVGQFTGLCDKNGKKIFEGDIVGFEDGMSTESGYAESGCTGCVYWDKETASFQVDNRLSAESYEVLEECAIIGNIYDNSKLLGDSA